MDAMPTPSRRATLADLPALVETIELAFVDDPVWGLVFAKAGDRGAEALWRILIEGALRHRWVWMTPEASAVAIWIPPGATELSDEQERAFARTADEVLGTVGAAYLDRVMGAFAAAHPHVEPHYYLSLLGTHPAHRGHGIGMKLLAETLALIDPANNARYARHGFEPLSEFNLPDHGPAVTTMWRPGQQGGR
jgi:ribosomal protein S18 acetylase RimI-like enzyme